MERIGLGRLYNDEVPGLERLRAGSDLIVSMLTASGRASSTRSTPSDRWPKDPESRAPFVYPTRAARVGRVRKLMGFAARPGSEDSRRGHLRW